MKDISLNFGAIKESILKLGSREFLHGERKSLDSFMKDINESHILKKQYLIFKSLDSDKQFKKERLAERFINQTLDIMNGISWGDVLKENRDLRIDYLDNTYVGSSSDKDDLFNNINTLLECKCLGYGNYDLSKEQQAYEIVLEHLMSEKKNQYVIEKNDEPDMSWEYITKIALSNFEDRYSHLSESEMELIKVLTSTNENKINHLFFLKEENLKKIKSLKESENEKEIISLLEIYESKINNMNPENVVDLDEAIIACFDLIQNLEK